MGKTVHDCHGMRLNAVQSADQHNCQIKHGKNPLHLAGKINMTRRIDYIDPGILPGDSRFLGVDRNSVFPFFGIIIKYGIPMIDPAACTDHTGTGKKGFNAGCFSCVRMRKDSGTDFSHNPKIIALSIRFLQKAE